MENVEPTYKHVAGAALGNQFAAILDPVYIFKGSYAQQLLVQNFMTQPIYGG
jgi:hypothetical protein